MWGGEQTSLHELLDGAHGQVEPFRQRFLFAVVRPHRRKSLHILGGLFSEIVD